MTVLYTVSDQKYLGLTLGLIKSVQENEPSIEKIVIGSIGLDKEAKILLAKEDKRVEIMTLDSVPESLNLHDGAWVERTKLKTKGLLALLEANHRIVMIDSDCIILKPFLQQLESVKKIGICRRERPALRKDIRLDHIASFFLGEGPDAVMFVKTWIEIQNKLIISDLPPPYETPAMCRAIRMWFPNQLVDLDEGVYSKQHNFNDGTFIAHLKSNAIGSTGNLLQTRLGALTSEDRKVVEGFY